MAMAETWDGCHQIYGNHGDGSLEEAGEGFTAPVLRAIVG